MEGGARRNGPLVEAVDQFVSEKIRELARVINSLRKQELDDRGLHEKSTGRAASSINSRTSSSPASARGRADQTGPGRGPVIVIRPEPPQEQHGTVPASLDYQMSLDGFHIGREVEVNLHAALAPDRTRVPTGVTCIGMAIPHSKHRVASHSPHLPPPMRDISVP